MLYICIGVVLQHNSNIIQHYNSGGIMPWKRPYIQLSSAEAVQLLCDVAENGSVASVKILANHHFDVRTKECLAVLDKVRAAGKSDVTELLEQAIASANSSEASWEVTYGQSERLSARLEKQRAKARLEILSK